MGGQGGVAEQPATYGLTTPTLPQVEAGITSITSLKGDGTSILYDQTARLSQNSITQPALHYILYGGFQRYIQPLRIKAETTGVSIQKKP